MGLFKGGFLRVLQTFLYALAFCCAAIILGIYSYFLSVLADRNLPISKSLKAVEGISGIAVIYTIFAILLTCCLAGVSFFSFLGLVLDVLFIGGFIALAVLTRSGARSCKGNVTTPLGSGSSSSSSGFGSGGFGSGSNENVTYSGSLGLSCRLNKAAFAVAIIGALIFLITALMQVVLARNHKKEKRYGPSPANNYTSGSGKKSFFRKRGGKNKAEKDAELGAVGAGAAGAGAAAHHHHNTRPSHDTAYTGSTVAAPNNGIVKDADPIPNGAGYGAGHSTGNAGYGAGAAPVAGSGTNHNTHGFYNHNTVDQLNPADGHANHGTHGTHGTHGGYYTQPQGTGVNPYGYDNSRTTGTATNY